MNGSVVSFGNPFADGNMSAADQFLICAVMPPGRSPPAVRGALIKQ